MPEEKETPRPEDLIGHAAFKRVLGCSTQTAYIWMRLGRVRTWTVDGRLMTSRAEADRARTEFRARRQARGQVATRAA